MPHRRELQGLRAVAVLLVVLDHAGLPFLQGGYVGVDVFFVLSGYLITGLLLRQARRDGRIRLSDFYVRRARRILPAAVLTLVVTDLVAHQLLNLVRAREAVSDSVWAAFFMANVHFAREGSDYFSQLQPPSPVQHYWTLAVEEQFYLVWPVVLAAVLAVPFLRRRLLWIVLAAGGASLAWSIHSTATDATYAYYSTATRAWELALGAALAIAAPRLRGAAAWLGLACICTAAVAFSSSTSFPGYAALLPTVGAALVIAAGRGSASRLLSLAPFRYVGDRSYAFYLWHWPVLVIAAEYVGHELSTVVRLGLLVGAFGLSILSYALYENPIRQMRWRPQTGALLWPASAAVILAVAVPILVSLNATGDADLQRRRRRPSGRAGHEGDRFARLLAAAARGRSSGECGQAERRPAVAADAGGHRPAPGLLRLPRRMRGRSRPDLEHGLSSRRVGCGQDDRRDRRLARADVDAHDPAHGPARRVGGGAVREGRLCPDQVAAHDRLGLHGLVPLGCRPRGQAPPAGDAHRGELGRRPAPDDRGAGGLGADRAREAFLRHDDRDRRLAAPAPQPGRLPARLVRDDAHLLREGFADRAADGRLGRRRPRRSTASASSRSRAGSARGPRASLCSARWW